MSGNRPPRGFWFNLRTYDRQLHEACDQPGGIVSEARWNCVAEPQEIIDSVETETVPPDTSLAVWRGMHMWAGQLTVGAVQEFTPDPTDDEVAPDSPVLMRLYYYSVPRLDIPLSDMVGVVRYEENVVAAGVYEDSMDLRTSGMNQSSELSRMKPTTEQYGRLIEILGTGSVGIHPPDDPTEY